MTPDSFVMLQDSKDIYFTTFIPFCLGEILMVFWDQYDESSKTTVKQIKLDTSITS